MIEACVELQVKRLIYTSSASVVFDGVHGIFNGDESLSYPVKVSISQCNSACMNFLRIANCQILFCNFTSIFSSHLGCFLHFLGIFS